MESSSIKVENLSFGYPCAEKLCLDGMDFSIKKGEFVTLCGLMGSGKSTLLKLLKKELTPEGTKKGRIFINGKDADEYRDGELAALVGFVGQEPDRQSVADTVYRELAFGLESLGVSQSIMSRRIAEVVSFFGIGDIFEKKLAELSGGQKQLVELAAVTAMRPQVLLLDEPTSQLDPIAAADFLSAVSRLNRETGITVVLADHLLEQTVEMCDRMMLLRSGKIACFDTPPNVCACVAEQPERELMPASARLFAQTGKTGICPVSVREGRRYVEENLSLDGTEVSCEKQMTLPEAVLEFKNVCFRYSKNSADVLKNTSFTVCKGEAFFILGGNGSGKTTTLCAAAGLRKAYAGKILVFGKKIEEYKNGSLYDGCVSYLPQDVESTFLKETLAEELGDAAEIFLSFGCSRKLLNKHPYDLSGGEKQLAALAKILRKKPKILLLDEPTKGLDACACRKFADILSELKASGITVVCVTHDVEFAAQCADRCALFFRGDICCSAPAREFFCENSFYTTAVRRMTFGIIKNAVTVEDVARLYKGAQEV